MKTACYCRCAYDNGISLEIQKEDMKSILQETGVEEQDIVFYAEYGSGISAKREELRRLLHDVKGGNIQAVYVKNISRLSRDFMLLDKIIHLLEKHHVTLVSIQEPEFGSERQSELLNEVKKLLSSRRCDIIDTKERIE